MGKKRATKPEKPQKARELSPAEKALFEECGFRFWNWVYRIADAEHACQIRDHVNPGGRNLRLYYPGSGADVVVPLLLTDASEFVLVDDCEDDRLEEKLHNELNSRGWSNCRLDDREVSYVEDGFGGVDDGNGGQAKRIKRTEFEFFFSGKPRNVVFYHADPGDFLPPEMEQVGEGEKAGFDVIFFRKPDEITNRELLWLWEMLSPDGVFVGMGEFRHGRSLFKNAGVVKANKKWDYEGSPILAPFVWTVFSKKRSDDEMSGLVQKSMELAQKKRRRSA